MIPAPIRRLSYNPTVRRVAQRLHVGGIARKLYCGLLSSTGTLTISCLGIDAVFKSHNQEQLAFVDCVFTTERAAIETTLGRLVTGDVFLDVGCNCGIYSVLASKLVGPAGRVIAVEPNPVVLQLLGENIAINDCWNVEVVASAFSDTTGPMTLAQSKNCSHSQRQSDPSSSLHTIQASTGDDALHGFPSPTVVKVDVEGHEFAVLSGLRETLSSKQCRTLCAEIHPQLLPDGVTESAILAFIRNCGFSDIAVIARVPEIIVVATRC